MVISDRRRPQPTSKKNRRLVLAGASQGGDSHCEIHDLPPFSLAAIWTDVFYCKERSLYFQCGYTCRRILKLHQFLYFIT